MTQIHLIDDDGAAPVRPGAASLSRAGVEPDPAVEPHPSRFRPFGTLTARLVAGVVALVVVVVFAIGAATYLRQKSFLYDRLDQQVNGQADATLGSVGPNNPFFTCKPAIDVCAIAPTSRRYGGGPGGDQSQWLVLLAPNGDVHSSIAASARADVIQLNLSESARASLASTDRTIRTVTTTDGHTIRVATRQADGYVIVSGLSTSEASDTLHSLLIVELLIGGAGILLAAALTAGGMYLGLRPLQRVTRTAQEVTAELSPEGAGLDRRVPETDSTTEVGQLATSFNTMLDTVETEFRARRDSEERMRQFLADASHELRTPLTSIRGYAELARMQSARGGSTGDQDSIGRIEAEGTRMSRLVEDLLILARGDDSSPDAAVDRAAVSIESIVDDVVAGVTVAHPERTIRASIDPGLSVWGDRDQLLRVLRNLTTNAAVHTDPAGAIRIEGHREGASVVIQVIDAGPGLPPDEAEHVFERFWRADKARTRVRGGSGLGMAIVAQIVGAHGGSVYFDSSVATGSTVTVVLPG